MDPTHPDTPIEEFYNESTPYQNGTLEGKLLGLRNRILNDVGGVLTAATPQACTFAGKLGIAHVRVEDVTSLANIQVTATLTGDAAESVVSRPSFHLTLFYRIENGQWTSTELLHSSPNQVTYGGSIPPVEATGAPVQVDYYINAIDRMCVPRKLASEGVVHMSVHPAEEARENEEPDAGSAEASTDREPSHAEQPAPVRDLGQQVWSAIGHACTSVDPAEPFCPADSIKSLENGTIKYTDYMKVLNQGTVFHLFFKTGGFSLDRVIDWKRRMTELREWVQTVLVASGAKTLFIIGRASFRGSGKGDTELSAKRTEAVVRAFNKVWEEIINQMRQIAADASSTPEEKNDAERIANALSSLSIRAAYFGRDAWQIPLEAVTNNPREASASDGTMFFVPLKDYGTNRDKADDLRLNLNQVVELVGSTWEPGENKTQLESSR
jgi:hypothetical protein